jgi:hypothetical protein
VVAGRRRFGMHRTSTYEWWLNMVERVFAKVADKCVRHGSHLNMAVPEAAIGRCEARLPRALAASGGPSESIRSRANRGPWCPERRRALAASATGHETRVGPAGGRYCASRVRGASAAGDTAASNAPTRPADQPAETWARGNLRGMDPIEYPADATAPPPPPKRSILRDRPAVPFHRNPLPIMAGRKRSTMGSTAWTNDRREVAALLAEVTGCHPCGHSCDGPSVPVVNVSA